LELLIGVVKRRKISMIELIATVIITASSALLFGYWFRYTCLLILSANTTRDYAGEFAAAVELSFPGVQAQLRGGAAASTAASLEGLQASLNRDYAVVTYLLKNVTDNGAGASSIEVRMLEINYKLMGTWFSVTKRFSTTAAARALEEMSLVVAHFANTMGERSEAAAAA
jgi:hypothetical protein